MLDFLDCAGSVTRRLLPTGNPVDLLETDNGRYHVSFVDAANPCVFLLAEELGLRGTELPAEIARDDRLLARLEEIRSAAAEVLGFVKDRREGTAKSPAIPKIAFVSPPTDYVASTGELIRAEEVSLVARIMSMQRPHKAYAVTGAVCTAVAAQVPGSVVNQVFRPIQPPSLVAIGHPAGIIRVDSVVEVGPHGVAVKRAALERTARRIMEGVAYVPLAKVGLRSQVEALAR